MANNKKDIKGSIPQILSKEPLTASIISKLNKDSSSQTIRPLDINIPNISLGIKQKINNNEDILAMFPDIELAIQIVTSSIISPNDMIQNSLNYQAPDIRIPSAIKQSILSLIESHIESNYELNSRLSLILKETLFTKGAYIEAIVPEASLDDIINQTGYNVNNTNVNFESYIQNYYKPTYDFLGNDKDSNKFNFTISTESNSIIKQKTSKTIEMSQEDLNIEITDNYNILNISNLLYKNTKYSSKKKVYKYNTSLEDDNINNLNKFFKDLSSYQTQEYIKVNTKEDASRESIGKPMVVKFPTESVIPVHVVNEPSKHLGYFVMLNENGSPIELMNNLNQQDVAYYNTNNLETDTRMNMVKKAKEALMGMTQEDQILDRLEDIYTNIVEGLIKKKLSSGQFGELAEIKESADIYRTMFYRALRSQQTRLLFLPSELVAYYAFEFRDNGTGKSWMEKASVFYSLKAILLFSRVMASLKNSTSITEVNSVLDEHDPDPETRAEQIMSEVLKTRQNNFPLGVMRPDDLVEWVQKNGLRFKFQHPKLPNYDITTSDVSTSKVIPDTDLEDKISEYIYMSFGLTPEIVQAGYSTDYATTVVAKNLLFAKRVKRLQEQFSPMVTDHIRKLIVNDMMLINGIKDIIKGSMKDIKKFISKLRKEDDSEVKKLKQKDIENYIIHAFLNELVVSLPTPETNEATAAKSAFDNYKTTLEESLDIVFNTSALPNDYFGNMADKVDAIKEMFKASCLLKWMSDNNYLPELSDAVVKDDEGNFIFNPLSDYSNFLNSLGESFLPFLKERLKEKEKLDKKLEKIENEADSSSSDYGSDDDNQDTNEENTEGEENTDDTDNDNTDEGIDDTGGEYTGDDTGGGDDMDMGDMDMGDEFGDESGGGSKDEKTSPELQKLEEELLKAKIEKEKALANRAQTEALIKGKENGIDPDSVDERKNIDTDENKKEETNEELPTEEPNQGNESYLKTKHVFKLK